MTTRRGFLGAAAGFAGLAFCGCGLTGPARAQPSGMRPKIARIGGKRVNLRRR
jgi:hypothetical protein